jgi:hypothetical protein
MEMTDTWDGYPENREPFSIHWLQFTAPEGTILVPAVWVRNEWAIPGKEHKWTPKEMAEKNGEFNYVGPCLTPAEVYDLVTEAVDEAVHNAIPEARNYDA